MITFLYLLCWCPSIPLEGYAISVMWHWFVAPLGVMDVGIMQGAGISLLLCLMRPLHPQTEEEDEAKELKRKVERIVLAYIGPLFFLAFGFVMHAFM